MILSDTLSRRPDFIPDKDTDNENMVLLPDKLFGLTAMTIHLIDTDLQQKIVDSNDLDTEATEAIEFLLGNGPTNLQKDLEDWTIQQFEGKNVLFIKDEITFPRIMNYDEKSPPLSTTKYRPDIQEKSKCSTRSKNIIGGQECEVSSRITLKAVESANNSR